MPTLAPWLILALVLAVTAAGMVAQATAVRRRRRWLGRLANAAGWGYQPADAFAVGGRVARLLPDLGAAGVRVRDLLFRPDPARGEMRLIFSVEYTVGITRQRRNRTRVVSCLDAGGRLGPLRIAPLDLGPEAQYRLLLGPDTPAGEC